ncbi:energy transducer TonB [Pectinatus brassicae]|uniref:TonB family protein n=1 Tax=Pectinatus brassicae TaxID=862415 RepID=A0A840UDU1_9FIRM|nr:energy transducer TonB [Pectinatus brassicae]MBB5335189.1 TonB family protein [Pectinatus brassicae]
MLSFSYNKTAWFTSLFIHLLLFISLASAGFFSVNHVNANPDTTIYIVDNNSTYLSSGGSNNEGTSANTNAITLSASQNNVSDTENPSAAQVSTTVTSLTKHYALTEHNASGTAAGTQYAGNSTGNGTGTNSGAASGNGQGYGSGSHPGNGSTSNPDALRVSIPPRPTNSPAPIYPDSMRTSGLEGTTSLTMLISASGHVENVTITSSSGQTAFDNAAINAAYKYKFVPARNSRNQNVRCRISKNFTFHLNN